MLVEHGGSGSKAAAPIAKKLFNSGAEIALTYQGEALKKRVAPLAKEINSSLVFECNVENESDIAKVFNEINSFCHKDKSCLTIKMMINCDEEKHMWLK